MTASGPSTSAIIAVIAALLFLRTLVGLHPHSGQDNHHGSKTAYGGDYEAQRHWMEITLHLSPGEWYWYDLEYWGLDYPPLTAYVSYLSGVGSSWLVGPETMALEDSRGYEDPTHKAYMRATVIVLDFLLYFPAVWMITKRLTPTNGRDWLWAFSLALAQPALVLIDHGHFQYNSVSLGLALLASYYMTQLDFQYCILGAVVFSLALNFKQMTLYYAPAIFFYLLGRCFRSPKQLIIRFVQLGVAVLVTFALLWWPFVANGPLESSVNDRLIQVLHRIFPFQRGLFEGKVSNLWCALSVKPISIRQRIPEDIQPMVAVLATSILILPACYKLFLVGKRNGSNVADLRMLLWGMASTGLAFFLASFQVHEKSILLGLAPISVLPWDDLDLTIWFSIASTWTLSPLLHVDRLESAYICTMIIFVSLTCLHRTLLVGKDRTHTSFFDRWPLIEWLIPLSYFGMALLHIVEVAMPPPSSLPDLYPVLWSIAGCVMICLTWLATCWHLYRNDDTKLKST